MQSADLERIVALVVQKLEQLGPARADDLRATSGGSGAAEDADASDSLILSERVVTLTTVEGRLNGVKHVLVPNDAVVTPSVHDLLRDCRVSVRRSKPRGSHNARTPRLFATQCLGDPSHWFAVLRDALGVVGDVYALDECVSQIANGRGGGKQGAILLTGAPALAACRANRHSHLRAAVAVTPKQWQAAIAECRPNVMMVQPSDETDLVSLVNRFCEAMTQGDAP